jgi:hypothetical protein
LIELVVLIDIVNYFVLILRERAIEREREREREKREREREERETERKRVEIERQRYLNYREHWFGSPSGLAMHPNFNGAWMQWLLRRSKRRIKDLTISIYIM